MTRLALGLFTTLTLLLPAPSALAVVTFDQSVTPAVIYGSGNLNGGFTVDRTGDVELGLRAKLRFDANNEPQDIYNSNGDGTYSFNAGHPDLTKPRPSWADGTTPIWSWDWSINSNYDGGTGSNIGGYTYRMDIDFHNGAGIQQFLSFDPISGLPFTPDNSFGNNSTATGGGVETSDPGTYAGFLTTFNVAQNSWNMEFYDAPASTFEFNPEVGGEYTIALTAFDSGNLPVSSVSINVLVSAVPEASSLLAVGLAGLTSLGVVWMRKKARS
jgi:hypothetical protein